LLNHGVPPDWIEQMDDDTFTGWVWNAMIYDGEHQWSDAAGRPIEKDPKRK
jgi:hypothetical protein